MTAGQTIEQAIVVSGYRYSKHQLGKKIALFLPDGSAYPMPSDLVTQEQFDEQGPSGRELAYAESSAYQTGISTSLTRITGLEISFTVENRPVYVELCLPYATASAAGASVYASILDAADGGTEATIQTVSTANGGANMFVRERITTPGDYIRRAGMLRYGGSGTLTNNFSGGADAITSSLAAIER